MEYAHRKIILVTRHLVDKNPHNIISQLTPQAENDRKVEKSHILEQNETPYLERSRHHPDSMDTESRLKQEISRDC